MPLIHSVPAPEVLIYAHVLVCVAMQWISDGASTIGHIISLPRTRTEHQAHQRQENKSGCSITRQVLGHAGIMMQSLKNKSPQEHPEDFVSFVGRIKGGQADSLI